MRNSFIQTLTELAQDPAVFLIAGDLGYGALDGYRAAYPEQFLNAGIAEQAMTAIAAGMALAGRKVVTYSIGNFPTMRALEQLRNDICYHRANVTVVAVGAGFAYGSAGMSHHATEDIAVLRALPGLTVFSPADPVEAAAATRAALCCDGPCYIRLGKGGEPVVAGNDIADIYRIRRLTAGDDIAILATGAIVGEGLAASQILAAQGISAAVYSAATLKPLDTDGLLRLARKYRLLVTLEEHNLIGGFGSAVSEVYADFGGGCPVLRIGIDDRYAEVAGSPAYLRGLFGLDAGRVADRIIARIQRL